MSQLSHLGANFFLFIMAALAMAAIFKLETGASQESEPKRAPIRISFNLKRNRYDHY